MTVGDLSFYSRYTKALLPECDQVPFVPTAEPTKTENPVVVLTVRVGTRSVEIPQSNTRGFKASGLVNISQVEHKNSLHQVSRRPSPMNSVMDNS